MGIYYKINIILKILYLIDDRKKVAKRLSIF
ncbi:hypothetical protein V518_1410 [Thermoanaerobacterium aotearoense SCUT27]|uniref:Uncharacterized protein n=2 Tax=Thermoanaerobacterium TaxID=28895 RepID=W9E8Z0_9THEO|nr:hypothetical protein Tsac_1667 [Thermoanaerobacterium saccharolyticum JW/SL-YS485]ETO38312.1 hypothetical protein V518_1410 [Thermoanaerobacterium aotearoense SCUT27]